MDQRQPDEELDLEEVRRALEERLAALRSRERELKRPPERGAAISFGKRIGEGTTEAIGRLTDVGVAEGLGNIDARVVRALEVLLQGADTHGAALPDAPVLWHPDTTIVGVHLEREELVARLDERVRGMWRDGLLAEVETLRAHGLESGPTAPRAIGYAQALAQLAGRMTEDEAIAETQALTRRYARRQVSWFRRYPGIRWVDAGTPGARLVAAAPHSP